MEERTVITTYEDDIPINEDVIDRTVPLNEEEREKWDRMLEDAEAEIQPQVELFFQFFKICEGILGAHICTRYLR